MTGDELRALSEDIWKHEPISTTARLIVCSVLDTRAARIDKEGEPTPWHRD